MNKRVLHYHRDNASMECGAIFSFHPENKIRQSSLLAMTGDIQHVYGGFLHNIFSNFPPWNDISKANEENSF